MRRLDVRVLDAVREQLDALGYPPTIAKLADRLGEAPSSVQKALVRLEREGLIARDHKRHRSLRLVGQPDLRAVPTEALEVELGRRGVTFRALSRIEPLRPERGAPCAATCCDQLVGRGHLFCRTHWFAVPAEVRNAILQAFGRRDQVAYEMAITRARDIIDNCGDGLPAGLRKVG